MVRAGRQTLLKWPRRSFGDAQALNTTRFPTTPPLDDPDHSLEPPLTLGVRRVQLERASQFEQLSLVCEVSWGIKVHVELCLASAGDPLGCSDRCQQSPAGAGEQGLGSCPRGLDRFPDHRIERSAERVDQRRCSTHATACMPSYPMISHWARCIATALGSMDRRSQDPQLGISNNCQVSTSSLRTSLTLPGLADGVDRWK